MYLGSSGTVVTVVGYRSIFGWSDIDTLGVADDVPAALVDSKLTQRP